MPQYSAIVPPEQAGDRLDRVLPGLVPGLSRSYGQQLIGSGHVLLNGRPARAAQKLRGGDSIVVEVPDPVPVATQPEPMDLRIVYEDDDVLVVDKPAGLVVHPAPGHAGGTLVN